MCFIEFFGLNCFSKETEFLFVSDYLYRSDGCFCGRIAVWVDRTNAARW